MEDARWGARSELGRRVRATGQFLCS